MIEILLVGSIGSVDPNSVAKIYKKEAIVCFANTCKNILLGKDTPTGKFELGYAKTFERGYGGEVIPFYETKSGTYAIHKIWKGRPVESRDKRILSDIIEDRFITSGCINVDDSTYKILLNYHFIEIFD